MSDSAVSRRVRHRLRRVAAEVSGAQWLKRCGQVPIRAGGVNLSLTESGQAWFTNLETCGSVWSCPCCVQRITAGRAAEVDQILDYAQREGYETALLTLTLRHRQGETLATVWDRLNAGWHHVNKRWSSETEKSAAKRAVAHAESVRAWQAGQRPRRPRALSPRRVGAAETAGVQGWVRATEVTHGANGWHAHLHVLVVLDPYADRAAQIARLDRFRATIEDLWIEGITKAGGSAVRVGADGANVAVDLRHSGAADLGAYLTKAGGVPADLAAEVTLGQVTKEGRRGADTPLGILSRLDTPSEQPRDRALWSEWVYTSRGRRFLTFAHGLRTAAGLDAEQSDDELAAAEDAADVGRPVLRMPLHTWQVVRRDPSTRCDLLEVCEIEGPNAAAELLEAWGLDYYWVYDGPEVAAQVYGDDLSPPRPPPN